MLLNNSAGNLLNKAKGAAGLGAKKAVLYIQKPDESSPGIGAGLASMAQQMKSKTASVLSENAIDQLSGLTDFKQGFYSLQVQYNPSSISLSGNADEVQVRSHQVQQSDEIFMQKIRPPAIILNMELIFNEVDNSDSFASAMYNPSIKSALKSVGNLFSSEYGVRLQTEALIGMLMQRSTRVVCFSWADMTFAGEVVSVDAKYTMFNTSGEPVHSVISLSIVQTVESKEDVNYWNNAFDSFFSGGGTLDTSAGENLNVIEGNGPLNKVKSVINIPFLK